MTFFFLNPIYSPFSRKIPENRSVKSLLWSLYSCKILHHTWLPFFCTLICQHFHFHGVSTFKYHLQVLVLSIEAISWVCDMNKCRKENVKHCRYIYLSAVVKDAEAFIKYGYSATFIMQRKVIEESIGYS